MKILHLMGPLRPSGMERMFVSGAPYFHQAGVESIIVGQGDHHPFAINLRQAGYRVELIPRIKKYRGARAWVRLLANERPDVVHIHTEEAFAVSTIGARMTLPTTPIIRTVHNVFMPSGKALLSRRLQAFIADPFIVAFIGVSPDVVENERRFGRDPHLVFNWVDDRFFEARAVRSKSKDSRNALVMVGNCSSIKNHIVVLRALQKTSLDLYFHGSERDASEEEVQILDRLERAGRLRYRGTGDPVESLVHARCFVLPSKYEGMGIALAEAVTVGVPAIINSAPGVHWAEAFPNVIAIDDCQIAWDHAIARVDADELPIEEIAQMGSPVDLSARRGVAELVATYSAHRLG